MSDAAATRSALAGTAARRREQKLTLVLLTIAALARLPFIWRGFGGHPDEWLVARSGLDLWLHGAYFPSRGPGYLFNEAMMGGLAWLGGSPACGAAAVAASLATLAYLRGLARRYGIANSFWMVLAFSFEPWFWASGTHDLDYIWGTGSLVAAFYYLEGGNFRLAGLAAAFGFGVRPTSALWIAPLLLRLLIVARGWRPILRFAVWAAVPALLPVSVFAARALASRTEVATHIGEQLYDVTKVVQHPLMQPLLAVYHLAELFGQLPALLLIGAAIYRFRSAIGGLLRRENWPWIYILVLLLLFLPFISLSEKPEYMLPALPGMFLILGRCLSDIWWKALTVAFVFNAFVTFGIGHAPRAGGLHLELAAPALRPGVLLFYAHRANERNDRVAQLGSELLRPAQIVRADPADLQFDSYYVASVLRRGPQARIACPLIPALVSYPDGKPPDITPSKSTWVQRPGRQPMLICCDTQSALVRHSTPSGRDGALKKAVAQFCRSDRATEPPSPSAAPR